MSRAARVGACPGRMPRSPATERATTKSASPAQTSRSGVTRCRSSGTGLLPLSAEPPGLLLGLLDPGHVERLRQEALDLAGPVDQGPVLLRQLVDAEDRDDVLSSLLRWRISLTR